MRPRGRRALFIINRESRLGRETEAEAASRLQAHGWELVRPARRTVEAIQDFVREVGTQQGIDAIIIGGGDGTLTHLADILIDCARPVGILPLGTANDLARSLSLPLSLEGALEVILQGHIEAVDVGRLNGKPFFNVASFGLSTRVTQSLGSETKRRFGRLGYGLEAFRALRRDESFRVQITTEQGVIERRVLQIAVGNGRSYGGMLVVDERATIDDGLLHLYGIGAQPLWRLLAHLPGLFSGRWSGQREVVNLEGPWFEIETRPVLDITADGEIKGRTPVRFDVAPAALRVFVPASAADEAIRGAAVGEGDRSA